jgi:hypothetical protein
MVFLRNIRENSVNFKEFCMKNRFKVPLVRLFGIIALVAVIGLTFVACDDGGGGDDPGNNTPGGNTPGGNTPGGNTGGTFTVTGIPSEYNGKYAYFSASIMRGDLSGFQSRDPLTLVQISNGSVSLPMWLSYPSWQRYSGNDTAVDAVLEIYNGQTRDSGKITEVSWPSIAFSNGSATKTWN